MLTRMVAERTDYGSTLHCYSVFDHFAYVVQLVLKRPWLYVMLMLCLCYAVEPFLFRGGQQLTKLSTIRVRQKMSKPKDNPMFGSLAAVFYSYLTSVE